MSVTGIQILGLGSAGELVARGTLAQPIIFQGPGGLRFELEAVDAQYDSSGNYVSGSIIENCIFENCVNPPLSGNFASGGSVRINQSAPHVKDCIMSGGVGLTSSGSIGLRIKGGQYDGNTQGPGVYIVGGSNFTIEGASCSRNPSGIIISGSINYTIKDCRVIGNYQDGGISISAMAFSVLGASFIDGCQIAFNSASVPGGGISLLSDQLTFVRNCNIFGNVSGGFGGGIYLAAINSPGPIRITGTTVIGNRASLGAGVLVDRWTDMSGDITNGSPNIIFGNIGQDIANIISIGAFNSQVDARNNCWGAYSVSTSGRILDFFTTPNLGMVLSTMPVSCGPMHTIGGASGGAAGGPVISASGSFSGALTINVRNAQPNVQGLIVANTAMSAQYISPLDFFVIPSLTGGAAVVPITTDLVGNWSTTFSFPAIPPPPTVLILQVATVDSQAPNGLIALSNALIGEF